MLNRGAIGFRLFENLCVPRASVVEEERHDFNHGRTRDTEGGKRNRKRCSIAVPSVFVCLKTSVSLVPLWLKKSVMILTTDARGTQRVGNGIGSDAQSRCHRFSFV